MAVNSYTWASAGTSTAHSETQTSAPTEPWANLLTDSVGVYSAAGKVQEAAI